MRVAGERRIPKDRGPVVLWLAVIWLVTVTGHMIWGSITGRGLYGLLADWLTQASGSYGGTLVFVAPLILLSFPSIWYLFGQLARGYCAARLMCEVVEKAEFQWRQPLRLAINGRRHPARIEFEATDFDDGRRASRSTPYESADACEKLAHLEGFTQVVISTGLDAVYFFRPGSTRRARARPRTSGSRARASAARARAGARAGRCGRRSRRR